MYISWKKNDKKILLAVCTVEVALRLFEFEKKKNDSVLLIHYIRKESSHALIPTRPLFLKHRVVTLSWVAGLFRGSHHVSQEFKNNVYPGGLRRFVTSKMWVPKKSFGKLIYSIHPSGCIYLALLTIYLI